MVPPPNSNTLSLEETNPTNFVKEDRRERVPFLPATLLKPHGFTFLSTELIVASTRVVDFTVILASALLANKIVAASGVNLENWHNYAMTTLSGGLLYGIAFQEIRGYDFKNIKSFKGQIGLILVVWPLILSALLTLGFFFGVSNFFSRIWAFGWTLSAVGLLILWRLALREIIAIGMRSGQLLRHLAVIGANEQSCRLIEELSAMREQGVVLVGLFDDRATRVPASVHGVAVTGTVDDLILLARETPIDEIIVSLPLSAETRLRSIFDRLRLLPADLRLDAVQLTGAFPVKRLSHFGSLPMLDVLDRPLKHWNGAVKRLEDLTIASIALLIQTPMLLLIALLIKLDSRGPVFFVQERFGYSNRTIKVLKFRTMYADRGDQTGGQRTVKSDPRVTRIGRYLRAWSLDELPQLFNVLRGDMSIIGPRPHAKHMKAGDKLYYEAVDAYFHRHRVRPGMTGWAQVHGLRGEIDSLEKAWRRVEYDLDYIERWSVWLDMKVLVLTVQTLLSRENAY